MEKLKKDNDEKLMNIISGYIYSELESENILDNLSDRELDNVENIVAISVEMALDIVEKLAIFDNERIAKAHSFVEKEKFEEAHNLIFSQ